MYDEQQRCARGGQTKTPLVIENFWKPLSAWPGPPPRTILSIELTPHPKKSAIMSHN